MYHVSFIFSSTLDTRLLPFFPDATITHDVDKDITECNLVLDYAAAQHRSWKCESVLDDTNERLYHGYYTA